MNEFEKYPPLAERMEQLANSNIPGWSMADWDGFCSAVNDALFNAWTAGGKYGWQPDQVGRQDADRRAADPTLTF